MLETDSLVSGDALKGRLALTHTFDVTWKFQLISKMHSLIHGSKAPACVWYLLFSQIDSNRCIRQLLVIHVVRKRDQLAVTSNRVVLDYQRQTFQYSGKVGSNDVGRRCSILHSVAKVVNNYIPVTPYH